MPKVVAIVEARMGSSRLPGKVLSDIFGKPALERLIARLRLSKRIDEIIVATTNSSKDDKLVAWLEGQEINFFRGSEQDVLQRVVDTSREANADVIVEINGDCILTDYEIIDEAIENFNKHNYDVVTNCGSILSYPMGAYAQVFRSKDLEWVAKNISDSAVREHVSLFFYENPDKYKIHDLVAPEEIRFPAWRLQLDYQEDLKFLNAVYQRLYPIYGDAFTLYDIKDLLHKEPELLDINKHCVENAPR
tara:strand:- start:12234 stop:12977 length:744 start_codon:yes stop_codon:yes gene_type:complete